MREVEDIQKGVEDMANKPTPLVDQILSEANARLVAAAPEMLGMLHLAFEAIRALWREEPWGEGEIPQVMDEIQELIAKVTKE
jgi:hypothetical protein